MIKTVLQYHDHTGYDRHHMSGHGLDWGNQPSVYKSYDGIEPIKLPRDICLPEERLSLILGESSTEEAPGVHDMEDISRILLLTNSLTAKARHSGGDFYYRCAASAGALYPTEIYVVPQGINNIEDGLYHFSISCHGLSLLRKGKLQANIIEAAPSIETKSPALTFFLSAIFFRSAWKYQDRSYRYHLMDTGHVVENMILALKSSGLPYTLSYDFDDHEVNRLIGLDETREVCLYIVSVSGLQDSSEIRTTEAPDFPDLPDEIRNASRVASREIDYSAVREVHEAGSVVISPSKPGVDMIDRLGVIPREWTKINPPATWPEFRNFSESVLSRRSKRNFVEEPMSCHQLTAILEGLCSNTLETGNSISRHYRAICTGFIIGNAEGFTPAFYLLDKSAKAVGMVSQGLFTDKMAHICLDQAWLANAAVHFLFMTNMETLGRKQGSRGYRYAMMMAGRMGERLYLMATAMGLGCCGIGAFFDGEAAELLGLNHESRLLYLVAVGPIKSG